jgi:hypothetical protein
MELLLMIIEDLDIHGCLALGLTCQYLWTLAVQAIRGTIQDKISWVGMRIICLSHQLKPGDLPHSLKKRSHGGICDNSVLDHETVGPYTLVHQNYDLIPANKGLQHWLLKQAYKDGWLNTTKKPRHLQQIILHNSSQVLRNLTQKCFVRGDGLPYGISLGHVVFIRTMWSGEPFARERTNVNLTRNYWAGDCFDIVATHVVEHAHMDGWHDYTDLVVAEITHIWIQRYGFRSRAQQWISTIPVPGVSWLPIVVNDDDNDD